VDLVLRRIVCFLRGPHLQSGEGPAAFLWGGVAPLGPVEGLQVGMGVKGGNLGRSSFFVPGDNWPLLVGYVVWKRGEKGTRDQPTTPVKGKSGLLWKGPPPSLWGPLVSWRGAGAICTVKRHG